MDPLQAFLAAVVVLGYGTATSFLQERFGKFQDLPAGVKQLINSILNLVVPYVAVFLQPYWRPEFGTLEEVVTTLAYLVVPAIVWVVSQVAHHFDPARLVAGSLQAK